MNQFVTGRSVASAAATEPWIDWGKALASQLIVWHHLVHYGPLAPRLSAFAPGLLAWLNDRALYAVQVFLVVGGYLAARSLWPQPGRPRVGPADWAPRVAQRWRRLNEQERAILRDAARESAAIQRRAHGRQRLVVLALLLRL